MCGRAVVMMRRLSGKRVVVSGMQKLVMVRGRLRSLLEFVGLRRRLDERLVRASIAVVVDEWATLC
jgi:hypothetical protein